MKRGLDIAFFGSSLVSAYWNGAATYYRGMIRALHDRGHRVTFYEPDAYERQRHRDIDDPPWARVVVYPGDDERAAVQMVEQAARSADVLVKASGVGVYDALLERAVLDAKRRGQIVVFWDVDAPATLERLTKDPADPFRALVPQYDMILTYGGGDRVVAAYIGFGARHCVPIYNALDPTTHYPAAADARFTADLGFLGNRLPDREARVEEFFLRPASACPEKRFVLGGSGWGDKPVPENVRYAGHVYTADHNAFNASTLAVLNVSRDSMAAVGFSPATRVFEAAGAGACIVTDAWVGIERFLAPGREIFVAETGDDVARILRELTPARARAVGEAARQRVLAEHTYAQRARQVEGLLAPRANIRQEATR
jgi:spore maturation protein CgeB